MKIKFVVPLDIHEPAEFRQISFIKMLLPPYGVGCLSAFLRKHGHSVSLQDFTPRERDYKMHLIALDNKKMHQKMSDYITRGVPDARLNAFSERMSEEIVDDTYDLIGFSVLSRYGLAAALLAAKKIRTMTNAPIVFGGAWITECAGYKKRNNIVQFLANHAFIDYIISGEGEVPLLKLLECLRGRIAIKDVPNLIYREGARVAVNERQLYDIEDMPLPDFDDVNFSLYAQRSYPAKIHLPYQITRGCNRRCSFCNMDIMTPHVEFKSHQKVISELLRLKERYNIAHFHFCECMLNISYRYLEELCDLMVHAKLNIKWQTVAGINNMDYKLLVKMRRAGCYLVAWGVESGSDRILNLMGKGYSSQEAATILKDASSVRIRNVVNIISGFVTETETDTLQTVSFMKKNAAHIDAIRLFDFGLAFSSPVYQHPAEFGIENIFTEYYSSASNGFVRLGYDEVGGLKWPALVKRKQKSYKRVKAEVRNIFLKKSFWKGKRAFKDRGPLKRIFRDLKMLLR